MDILWKLTYSGVPTTYARYMAGLVPFISLETMKRGGGDPKLDLQVTRKKEFSVSRSNFRAVLGGGEGAQAAGESNYDSLEVAKRPAI